MRIGSYNMLCFEGWEFAASKLELGEMDDPRRVERFANAISALQCDIFCLQEGSSVERMKAVAKALDVNLAALPSATRFCGGVFTPYSILETRCFSNCGPKGKDEPYSRCGGAALIQHEQELLWIVNIHIYPHTEEMRQREAMALARHLESLVATGHEIAVMGDFNSPVTGCVHDAVRRFGLVNAKEKCGGLEPTTTNKEGVGKAAIDHIYLSAGLASRLKAAKVVSEPGYRLQKPMEPGMWVYSDHLPVVVDIDGD